MKNNNRIYIEYSRPTSWRHLLLLIVSIQYTLECMLVSAYTNVSIRKCKSLNNNTDKWKNHQQKVKIKKILKTGRDDLEFRLRFWVCLHGAVLILAQREREREKSKCLLWLAPFSGLVILEFIHSCIYSLSSTLQWSWQIIYERYGVLHHASYILSVTNVWCSNGISHLTIRICTKTSYIVFKIRESGFIKIWFWIQSVYTWL